MLHKSIVLEVSCLAPSEGRSAYLGVLYDEIVRKHWEDMCGKVHTFDVQLHAGILQEDILRRARAHCLVMEAALELPALQQLPGCNEMIQSRSI